MGNVLVFFSHDRMIQNIAEFSGADEASIRNFLFRDGFQDAIETGRLSENEFHQQFEQQLGVSVSLDDLRHALGNIFELNEPMLSLLDDLRNAGVRLVLLSNTCRTHIDFVRQNWDVLDRFDAVTTSCEVGAMKPDPRIFESAIRQANCPAADCFFTDDIENYIQQARKQGLEAHVFRDAATTRQTLLDLGVRF